MLVEFTPMPSAFPRSFERSRSAAGIYLECVMVIIAPVRWILMLEGTEQDFKGDTRSWGNSLGHQVIQFS